MSAFSEARYRQQAIGARLKTLLIDVVNEPAPADFQNILQRADAANDDHPAAAAPPLDLERVAALAHEVNRVWCQANGDDSQPPWEAAPDWQRASSMDTVRFFLANPGADAGATHRAWMEEQRGQGWTWGPVKDAALKQHPCLVPFEQLPKEEQFKDMLIKTVVAFGLGRL